MTIKAIIWDVGGVLLRTEDFSSRDALAQELGLTRQQIDQAVFHGVTGDAAQCGRIPLEQHWQALGRTLQLDPAGLSQFRRRFFAGDVLDQALVERIRGLRPRYKTAILSNAFSDLRQWLDQWKIADAFDSVIVSAEVGVMKPHPHIYQAALDALDVAPQEALFIDDFTRNIAGAEALGMHAIHFINPHQTWQDLTHHLSQSE